LRALRLLEHALELRLDEAVALHHLADEDLYFGMLGIGCPRRGGQQQQRKEKPDQSARTSLRSRIAPLALGCAP
jgi:hypothetical protein